jgi:hypothetical protein
MNPMPSLSLERTVKITLHLLSPAALVERPAPE